MKGFIVMCFVACAVAAPQYNYQPGGGNQGFQSTAGFGSGGQVAGGGGAGFGSTSIGSSGFGGSGAGLGFSGSSSGGGGAGIGIASAGLQTVANFGNRQSGGGAGFNTGFSAGSSFSQQSQAQQPAIVSKQFYIHSAPEENDDDGISKTVSLGPAHKHYRVVFIKAPHASAKSSSVRFTAPQNEEKTVIYVLSKKTDAADIQTNIDAAHSAPSKPEVFFIKYKTPEEARHAQQQIQAQYDALGGTSQISDEGVAPLTSVIGALGGGNEQSRAGFVGSGSSSVSQGVGFNSQSSGSISGSGSVNGYLPPN